MENYFAKNVENGTGKGIVYSLWIGACMLVKEWKRNGTTISGLEFRVEHRAGRIGQEP